MAAFLANNRHYMHFYKEIEPQHVARLVHSGLPIRPQSHIYDFGPGRATVHPDLAR